MGKQWSLDLLEPAMDLMIKQDLFVAASAPGGMAEYRRALAGSFLFKFILYVQSQLGTAVDSSDLSTIEPKLRPVSQGTQVYIDSPYDILILRCLIIKFDMLVRRWKWVKVENTCRH